MLPLMDQLIRHKWWANDNLLRSIEQHKTAAEDPELRRLLHHILVANRYWLLLTLGQPFIDEDEKRIPDSHAALTEQFRQTQQQRAGLALSRYYLRVRQAPPASCTS